MANNVTVVDHNICRASTQIHNSRTIALLILRKNSLRHNHRIRVGTRQLQTREFEYHIQAIERSLIAKDKVESRRETTAERTNRILHLQTAIYREILGYTLENNLILRSDYLLHSQKEGIDIRLRDSVLRITSIDMIREGCTTNVSTRKACVCLTDADIEFLLNLGLRSLDTLANLIEILNHASLHALCRFRYDSINNHLTAGVLRANDHNDIRRTYIDSDYIIFLLHNSTSSIRPVRRILHLWLSSNPNLCY